MRTFRFNRGEWVLGQRIYLMGVLNCTPDSFSDGGQYVALEDALQQAQVLIDEGADVIDLGAESTRPGYKPISCQEEWSRLAPVIAGIQGRWPQVVLSVDTQKACVAQKAIAAGVDIINDIWGLQGDPNMNEVVAHSRAGVIMMYNRDPVFPRGEVSIDHMLEFFERGIAQAQEAGIAPERILIDPGLGFGYAVEDNWTVLHSLSKFSGLGAGLLLGPSRKRFLGQLIDAPPQARDGVTAVVSVLAAERGMDVVRVHNIPVTRDALKVWEAWRDA